MSKPSTGGQGSVQCEDGRRVVEVEVQVPDGLESQAYDGTGM